MTLMILNLLDLPVGCAFFQKKRKTHKPTIFDKLNGFTENEGNKCKYYKSDQLNDLG